MVGNVTLQMHCPEQSPQCYQPKHNEEKVKGKKGLWCYSLQLLYLSVRYLQIGYAIFWSQRKRVISFSKSRSHCRNLPTHCKFAIDRCLLRLATNSLVYQEMKGIS